MNRKKALRLISLSAAIPLVPKVNFPYSLSPSGFPANQLSADDTRSIAKEAYVYGFPLVDGYRILHAYFADKTGKEYKTGWNQIYNTARVYTPADKAVQTPNSDTPYSFIGADLRAEPLVITIPSIEKNRYLSLQFVDLYTFNFAYAGSRTTGNGGGSFLLAGPDWKGEKPAGIKEIIRSETELAVVIFRTQLFNPGDLDNVKKIQAQFTLQPLSAFLRKAAPPAVAPIAFLKPLSPAQEKTSPEFFNLLNFVLGFCAIHPSETELMNRLGKIGVVPGKPFDAGKLAPEKRKALTDGMTDGWHEFENFKAGLDKGTNVSTPRFGTRERLNNNYLARMAGAALGIYGNSKEEAVYESYRVDDIGKHLDGNNNYSLYFPEGQLPPANAFWSLTMYKLPEILLVENPIKRYLINSAMLPDLVKDAKGGITLYIQNSAPAKDKMANWLPAPAGPFSLTIRIYWPDDTALNGTWKRPPIKIIPK